MFMVIFFVLKYGKNLIWWVREFSDSIKNFRELLIFFYIVLDLCEFYWKSFKILLLFFKCVVLLRIKFVYYGCFKGL